MIAHSLVTRARSLAALGLALGGFGVLGALGVSACAGKNGDNSGVSEKQATSGAGAAGEGAAGESPANPARAKDVPALKVAQPFAEGNGHLVEVPVPGVAEVAFRVLFYTGSVDDPPGKEGLTALTARLMAEGGTKKMTYPQILRALYPLATEISVGVDKEQTVFGGKVHVDHAARFVPILADVIKEPRLPEADFARIRDDMVNDIEKRLRATDDENLGKEMLGLMLYGADHPYGHFNGGNVAALKSLTIADVRAHAAKMFGKKRMLIGIGGAIDAAAKDAITNALASLPDGDARLAQIPSVPKPDKPAVLIAEKPGKAVAISIGYTHSAFRGHPDFPELGLIQSYFGEHRQFHGVLMSEMREKRGLNYGDYAYVEKFIQQGGSRFPLTNIARRQQHFEIWIRPVDPKDAVYSLRLALYLLDRLATKGVPERGIEDTRSFLAGYTRLWDLTVSRKVGFALDDQFYGTSNYLEAYRNALSQMKPADVDIALQRNLSAWPVKIAIVAPDAAALKAALVSGEKTEKKYDANVDPAVLEMDKAVSVFPLKLTDADIETVKVDALFVDRADGKK